MRPGSGSTGRGPASRLEAAVSLGDTRPGPQAPPHTSPRHRDSTASHTNGRVTPKKGHACAARACCSHPPYTRAEAAGRLSTTLTGCARQYPLWRTNSREPLPDGEEGTQRTTVPNPRNPCPRNPSPADISARASSLLFADAGLAFHNATTAVAGEAWRQRDGGCISCSRHQV